jgi:hypothetical protein
MLPAIAESPGVMLLTGQYEHFKKDHAKKKVWSDIISTNVIGRKTYCHIYAKKQAKCNPPGSGNEAITWIEILFLKPVMHNDPCIMRWNRDDISLLFPGTSNLEPIFWTTRRVFLWWLQKRLKPFALPSVRKTPCTLDEATFLSEQHLPSPEVTPLGGRKVYHTGNQDVVIPGFSAHNFIKTRKHTHWLARVWNSPQDFT